MIYSTIVQKIPIEKGWSGDQKYQAIAADGTKYLLRISQAERAQRKQREFAQMQKVAALGIPMCLPVECGFCEQGFYSLQSFIEGVDAEECMATLSRSQQYAYGLDAGRILARIHTIPAPDGVPSWQSRFDAKIDRKIAMYRDCELKYDVDQPLFDFIAHNRHALAGRPQTYQHGDYHVGNMMIDTTGQLVIIDFDREDYGDPWEEFNRIVWCAAVAPAFASGMVDGYFDGNVPMEFWQLLALYISSNTLSSLPWAIPFGEQEISVMKKQQAEVLAWYDDMKQVIPVWYKSQSKEHVGNEIRDRQKHI